MKLPKIEVVLTIKTAKIQNEIIKLFIKNGIDVYSGTTEHDPYYPYLIWDGSYLTQTSSLDRGDEHILCNTKEEFLYHFGINLEPVYEIY